MQTGFSIGEVNFSADSLARRPDHAAIIGQVMATWSLVEAYAAAILAMTTKSEPRITVELLKSFKSNRSRIECIRKITKATLPDQKKLSFENLMQKILSFAKTRNDFAHGVWGVGDDPDLVHWVPSSVVTKCAIPGLHKSSGEMQSHLEEVQKSLRCYTLRDLRNALGEVMSLSSETMDEMMILMPDYFAHTAIR